jgi:hypothetical protein
MRSLQATCLKTAGCGGFNYPHGILKQLSCGSKISASSTTLYVKQDKPQPPPPPPSPPPQWVGSWALSDRYVFGLLILHELVLLGSWS